MQSHKKLIQFLIKMWSTLWSIGKKIGKYCAIAFTGYEISDKLNSNEKSQVLKETTIIKQEPIEKSPSEILLIITAIVLVGIIFTAATQVTKCLKNKNNNNSTANANIQLEAIQVPAPEPASRRQ